MRFLVMLSQKSEICKTSPVFPFFMINTVRHWTMICPIRGIVLYECQFVSLSKMEAIVTLITKYLISAVLATVLTHR